jgi:hypothetical protein
MIRALIAWLVALVGLLCMGSALADPAVVVAWQWASDPTAPFVSSPQAACDFYNQKQAAAGNTTARATAVADPGGAAGYKCDITVSGSHVSYGSLNWRFGCPDGQTPVNGQCPTACSDKNLYQRKFYYTNGGPYIAPTHYGICAIDVVSMVDCRTDAGGTYCFWQWKRNGTIYTGPDVPGNGGNGSSDGTDPKTNPQVKSPPMSNTAADPKICKNCAPCPVGTVQAGIDSSGIPVCMGTGTAPPDPPKPPTVTTNPTTTISNSDGSTTSTQTQTQANTDGSTTTTTTTTTTSAGGAVTVSKNVQTSNTPSGSSGSMDSPSTDQNNLCKLNPNLTICQNSSVSGTCGDIACVGDAIQCATLRAAAAMQCQQQKTEDDLKASSQYTLGSAAASGADPAASTLPTPSKADVVTMSNPDTSGWLGGGSYFRDKTVTLPGGQSLVLPLSQGANLMIALRYVTMIVCSLVCFKIIRGTFAATGV